MAKLASEANRNSSAPRLPAAIANPRPNCFAFLFSPSVKSNQATPNGSSNTIATAPLRRSGLRTSGMLSDCSVGNTLGSIRTIEPPITRIAPRKR
jgi:hypothetical protein